MSEEIVEILDYLQSDNNYEIGNGDYERTLYKYEIEKILDYIKSLQQENKQLKIKSDLLEENNKLLIRQKTQMYEDLDIAYERIDKAIKYIKNCIDNTGWLEILGDKEND